MGCHPVHPRLLSKHRMKGVLAMKETVQEYVQQIKRKLGHQDPLKVQAATGKKLARSIRGKSPAALRKRPAPDKWSAAEILAHLTDLEVVQGWRMRSILGQPGIAIQAFDQDAWVVASHYDNKDARKSLEQFLVLRQMNLALLKTLTAEQSKHHGMHSERGEESIERIVRMVAGHDVNHLEQIQALLTRKK
jgi:DinB superfamily